ncbi:MAG: hypothetical protein ACI89D_000059 [Bermanella sp.]|jgi:hypothetical protein
MPEILGVAPLSLLASAAMPALGAVLGFLLGLIGDMLIQHSG